jgi:thioredoxin 1
MKHIKNTIEFEKLWNESQALVCDFSATWCGPCKALEPILAKLEKEHPDIVFAKVDIEKHAELSDEHKVQAVPIMFFVRKGKVLRKIVGVESYRNLSKQAKKLLAHEADR